MATMRLALAAVLLFALTACGGGSDEPAAKPTASPTSASPTSTPTPTPTPADPTTELKAAVQAYSDAYLAGDGAGAFKLLSSRCQTEIGKQPFTAEVEDAGTNFGDPIPLKTFKASVDGEDATVTYTYSVAAINQADQPWTLEGGAWRYNDC